MRAEETTIQIFGRELRVEIEGLTPMEVSALAQQVSDKMQEMQRLSGTADSSKLAMLAGLHFAAELQQAAHKANTVLESDEQRVDRSVEKLRRALRAK